MARVALCEVRGLLIDTIEKLSGDDGTEWAEEIKQTLRKGVASLLRKVREVAVGGTQKFVATDAFGENNPDGIKFYLWPNFANNFLGKIEEDVKPATIAVHRLEKASRDDKIMAEMGIDIKTKKGVIKLVHFREMLKAQAQGQEGPLLVNGYANIAYIEDENGKVWAVPRGLALGRPRVGCPCLLRRGPGRVGCGQPGFLASILGTWVFGPLVLGSQSQRR